MFRTCLIAALVVSVAASMVNAADAVDLSTLRREHPRLFLPDLDLPRLKRAIEADPQLADWHARLTEEATKLLTASPVERVLIGPRLLAKSKQALNRVSLLAALYRLDGDERFADRAVKEMLAAAAFGDWNPSHFLDVAEMTNALGIGYDWLYERLTPEERKTIREAIVEKGLKPGLLVYRGATTRSAFWKTATHNWNQVCNGGLTVGALAIADEEPEIATEVLTKARASIPLALASYAPDGGWVEGPGYWNYASQYTAFYLAAVHGALGTDFDLLKSPGLSRAGEFRVQSLGPIGLTFNYADAGAGVGVSPAMFYFGHAFGRPDYVAHEMKLVEGRGRGSTRPVAQPNIFHLLWSPQAWKDSPAGATTRSGAAATNRDALFRAVHVACFRSAFEDPRATYVGFKGGDNKANHAHYDLGTFVLDALGQRWAVDLGGDDYNLPGYFGRNRGNYYRTRTEGHNTLTIGTENQISDAKAPIVAFSSKPDEAYAVADLSAAYAGSLRLARRGIRLFDGRRRVLVQDEAEVGEKPVELFWNFHTPAKVELDGASATLTLGGETMRVTILSPEGARFELLNANPPPPQRQQPVVKNLAINLSGASGAVRIAVLFSPAGSEDRGATPLQPLSEWIADAPVR